MYFKKFNVWNAFMCFKNTLKRFKFTFLPVEKRNCSYFVWIFFNARDRKGFPLEHVPLLLFHKGECPTINCSKTQPSARRCAPVYVLTASLQQATLPLLSCHRPKKKERFIVTMLQCRLIIGVSGLKSSVSTTDWWIVLVCSFISGIWSFHKNHQLRDFASWTSM